MPNTYCLCIQAAHGPRNEKARAFGSGSDWFKVGRGALAASPLIGLSLLLWNAASPTGASAVGNGPESAKRKEA
jgi:hypothetical protein